MNITLPEAKSGGIPDGSYKAKLSTVESVPPNLDKGYKAALKFVFEVTEGDYKGAKVSRIVGIANGPKAMLPGVLKSIMKADPKPGGIDLQPYIGREYMVSVTKRVEAIIALW
jgi:hypothetical protein